MIKGVKFVTIPVRDQQQALEFYTGKLGFSVLTDQPFDDKQRWIELGVPGSETRIVLFNVPNLESMIGNFSNVVFWTADVQKTYEELSGRGVEFVMPPKKEAWGTTCIFKDLHGTQFVLSSK